MVVNSDLPYPEGRAAAEILKVGSQNHGDSAKQSASGMKEIVSGGIFAGIISLFTNGFHYLAGEMSFWFGVGRGVTQFPLASPLPYSVPVSLSVSPVVSLSWLV